MMFSLIKEIRLLLRYCPKPANFSGGCFCLQSAFLQEAGQKPREIPTTPLEQLLRKAVVTVLQPGESQEGKTRKVRTW